MSERQEQEIGEAIENVFDEDNEGGLCCTIEAVNGQGQNMAIQVMQDSINIAPYPFQDDPLERLRESGALEELADSDVELVEWKASQFATLGIDGLDAEEVASLLDRIFVKVLACDDQAYAIDAKTEDLG
jgi:hypothetical protein